MKGLAAVVVLVFVSMMPAGAGAQHSPIPVVIQDLGCTLCGTGDVFGQNVQLFNPDDGSLAVQVTVYASRNRFLIDILGTVIFSDTVAAHPGVTNVPLG